MTDTTPAYDITNLGLAPRPAAAPQLATVLAQQDPTTGIVDLYDTAGGRHLGRLDTELETALKRHTLELELELAATTRALGDAAEILIRLTQINPTQTSPALRRLQHQATELLARARPLTNAADVRERIDRVLHGATFPEPRTIDVEITADATAVAEAFARAQASANKVFEGGPYLPPPTEDLDVEIDLDADRIVDALRTTDRTPATSIDIDSAAAGAALSGIPADGEPVTTDTIPLDPDAEVTPT